MQEAYYYEQNYVFHLQKDWATGAYTTISANKPIMVGMFAKTFKNDGPNKGDPAFSLLIPTEMMPGVDVWGKEFITTSTPDRGIGDLFRIMAAESGTTVTFGSGGSCSLSQAGDFCEVGSNLRHGAMCVVGNLFFTFEYIRETQGICKKNRE